MVYRFSCIARAALKLDASGDFFPKHVVRGTSLAYDLGCGLTCWPELEDDPHENSWLVF